jgi:2-polyprenyl-6-methoxyphenol hydroxylase-like FAD-dependent oxidoreductase
MTHGKRSGEHAIVIGGSMAGLMVTRVLSDHFTRVTMIERDKLNDSAEARKGQPQARHLHGLLAAGLETLSHYFPDLKEGLGAEGALFDDMGATMRWYAFGGYRLQYKSGLIGAMMSRPLLEWQIRKRVMALPNVETRDECSVLRLITAGDPKEVTGIEIEDRAQAGRKEILNADLVVDAGGRGSAVPKWLAEMNYQPPQETEIKINVGYATRIYRRGPNDLPEGELLMISPQPPHDKRGGFMFPIEGDRWIVTLGCWSGDYPPTDEAGYLEFARSLAAPDIYNLISRIEPLSEILPYRFPCSLRRHYEKLTRFPAGLLVAGDAICSFNPVYGQGMTSATLQAAALDRVLQKQPERSNLARAFFKEAAKVVDIPWQLAVGEDFRYPETTGPKAPETDLINRYVERVHKATHSDPVVYGAFLQVMNLMKPPLSLFHPKIVWRVLRNKPSVQQSSLQPVTA